MSLTCPLGFARDSEHPPHHLTHSVCPARALPTPSSSPSTSDPRSRPVAPPAGPAACSLPVPLPVPPLACSAPWRRPPSAHRRLPPPRHAVRRLVLFSFLAVGPHHLLRPHRLGIDEVRAGLLRLHLRLIHATVALHEGQALLRPRPIARRGDGPAQPKPGVALAVLERIDGHFHLAVLVLGRHAQIAALRGP